MVTKSVVVGVIVFCIMVVFAVLGQGVRDRQQITYPEIVAAEENLADMADYIDNKRLRMLEDYEVPLPVLTINRQGDDMLNIEIYGNVPNGQPIVIIHPDGHVDLNGDPNEAAKQFWNAVSHYYPKCECNRRQRRAR